MDFIKSLWCVHRNGKKIIGAYSLNNCHKLDVTISSLSYVVIELRCVVASLRKYDITVATKHEILTTERYFVEDIILLLDLMH